MGGSREAVKEREEAEREGGIPLSLPTTEWGGYGGTGKQPRARQCPYKLHLQTVPSRAAHPAHQPPSPTARAFLSFASLRILDCLPLLCSPRPTQFSLSPSASLAPSLHPAASIHKHQTVRLRRRRHHHHQHHRRRRPVHALVAMRAVLSGLGLGDCNNLLVLTRNGQASQLVTD